MSDLERAEVLDFGVGQDHLMNILLHDHGKLPIPDKGIQSLTKVLHAARESLGLEFCPLLPDVACLLLSFMPVSQQLHVPSSFVLPIGVCNDHSIAYSLQESYAYAIVRQMVIDDSTYFLAISRALTVLVPM